MRKAFRHTGVLMMVAVVALGLLGAAYTLWYEQLTAQVNVNTGTFNADWSFHPWTAPGSEPGEGSFSGSSANTGAGKPVVYQPTQAQTFLTGGVASVLGLGGGSQGYALFTHSNFFFNNVEKPNTVCNGAITSNNDPNNSNDHNADNNVLTLNMGGLFPYAGCEFQIDLHNAGTVPFHIAITGITGTKCDYNPTTNAETNCQALDPNSFPWTRGFDQSLPDAAQCNAFFGAEWPWPPHAGTNSNPNPGPQVISGVQVHPGDDMLCGVKFILDEDAGAEGKAYHVKIHYATFQWNENPSPSLFPAPQP